MLVDGLVRRRGQVGFRGNQKTSAVENSTTAEWSEIGKYASVVRGTGTEGPHKAAQPQQRHRLHKCCGYTVGLGEVIKRWRWLEGSARVGPDGGRETSAIES